MCKNAHAKAKKLNRLLFMAMLYRPFVLKELFDVVKRLHRLKLLCGSVVEHCVSGAKGCGFDSQGTHILMKMYNLDAIVSRFG